jgi:uncharacterized cofD-like protein
LADAPLVKTATQRNRNFRIIAVGGGTGLSTLLRGLKEYVAPRQGQTSRHPISDLVAVVTVTDDGGSSGRLRRDYGMLPPGDIRNCMVALSQDEALMGRLFQYRFLAGRGLKGHSFGNLFLTALSHITGDFTRAVRVSSEVLAIRGRIFPSTNQLVSLAAVLENGKSVQGESRISRSRAPIRRVRLVPRRVKPLPEVLQAFATADLILIGPGSLYTSIIPNLLVPGVVDAIEKSRAPRVYIANLMTQPGETTHLSLPDHIRAIHQHTGRKLLDWVVVNNAAVGPEIARRYRNKGSEPVRVDAAELKRLGLRAIFGNVLDAQTVVRHDPRRLAGLLLDRFVERDENRRLTRNKARRAR